MVKNKNLEQLNAFDTPKFDLWTKIKQTDKTEFTYRFVSPISKICIWTLFIFFMVCLVVSIALPDKYFGSSIATFLGGYLMLLFASYSLKKNKKIQEEWMVKKKYLKPFKKEKEKRKRAKSIIVGLSIGLIIVIVYLVGFMNGAFQLMLGSMLTEDNCTPDKGLVYLGENSCMKENSDYAVLFNCKGTKSILGIHVGKEMNNFEKVIGQMQVFGITGCFNRIIPITYGD